MAGNITLETAFPSDAAGNPIQPQLGEQFWMTAQYQVAAGETSAMRIGNPWQQFTSGAFYSEVGTRQATFGPLVALYDGPMPVQVSVGDSTLQVQVQPAQATYSIEYFNPMTWQASFGANILFKPNTTAKIEWLLPKAPTFGFQSVLVTRANQGTLIASDVYRQLNGNEASAAFNATVSSVRVDAAALRTIGFTSLKKIPTNIKPFLKSETLIEISDKNVKSLVATSLPKNFAKTMSIYDAAQTLYRSVVRRIQYTETPSGKPSAAQALRYGYGDCGFFASAFTAACRNAGIPARPITGFLAGNDEWHVWAEFYVPGHGWIPVDPSFADGLDPQGNYPLYFGVIPELNQRVATAIGFDHSFSKYKLPMLQSPYAITDVKKVASAWSWSNLVPVPSY